jgi:hypothetical protein
MSAVGAADNLLAMLDHSALKPLADLPRWTFSDSSKRPIDMVALRDRDQVFGAKFRDARCLVPARQVWSILSARGAVELPNLAFFLDAQRDRLAVVDIEPDCASEARLRLERLPALYREVSMSGRGLHLLMPLPSTVGLETFNRVKLKSPTDRWEVLLHQFCTFTGRQAEAEHTGPTDGDWQQTWSGLEDSLRQSSSRLDGGKAAHVEGYGPTTVSELDLANLGALLKANTRLKHIAARDVAEWGGDHSKKEFAFINAALDFLDQHIERRRQFRSDSAIEVEDRIALVERAFIRHIPHRAKHNEMRADGSFIQRRVRWTLERRLQ